MSIGTTHDAPTSRGTARSSRPIKISLIVEQHLGHRTYAENLVAAWGRDPAIDLHVVPVSYAEAPGRLARLPVGRQGRAVLAARGEMSTVADIDAHAHVFNTQVPAVIGPRSARRAPYVLVTDVTPRQYDRMAEGYGHRPDRGGPVAAAKHRWNRHVFQRARMTVGWSSWVRSSLIDDYDLSPDRIAVIPPGVDTKSWAPGERPADGPTRLLFVGGDFERKGGRDLLEAFATLPSGSANLVVVTKTEVPRVDGVEVIDDLAPNDERLVDLYRSSDVFVLPTRSETFGIAAVEASAAGLPVIASDVGGLPDIVAEGETGFLTRPGDTAALARRLRTLVESVELRRRLGAAGRRRAQRRFDATTNAAQLLEVVRRSTSR